MDLKGRWALVTGASSGIGADIARELSDLGMHCVLLARREDRLRDLARELHERTGVECEIEAVDLGQPGAARDLHGRLEARGRQIDVLVNNAGFGGHGNFLDQDLARITSMIQVNVVALTELTHVFARAMAARGEGYVLNIASIAALQPVPSYSAYAATKAYVLSLSEAIALECADRGVHVTTCMPGVTWTEFFEVTGQDVTTFGKLTGMKSPAVARAAVDAMMQGRSAVVAGWRNKFVMGMSAPFPRRFKAWMTWQLNRTDRKKG